MALIKLNTKSLPAGSVIQVKHTQVTVRGTQAIAQNTDTLVSGFTVNITPTSTSSIIQLFAQMVGEFDHGSGGHNNIFYFMRDTTKLAHTGTVTGTQQAGVCPITQTYGIGSNALTTLEAGMLSFFDTPSTVSQITYKLGFRGKQNCTFHINGTVQNTGNAAEELGTSFISAMEIAG
tara:strand:+ start:65 stop:595 length:531 start_codon:yes stop_codon:yes gene_type:complete